VADGHPDEVGDTIPLMKATGARAVVAFEVGVWMTLEHDVPAAQTVRSGPGSVHRFDGITVYTLNAVHGSGIQARPDQARVYGGPALSFMVTFENGYTIYFSGSSAATMDMSLWGDWYKPDAAILHAQDSHDPRSAASVGKFLTTNNPNLRTVFPHHHRLQPQPGSLFRPTDLQAELERMGVNVNFINPTPLQPYTLTK
jgi:L-ascorbate metabolism protein UlaG (beta-lactamase superfamily)